MGGVVVSKKEKNKSDPFGNILKDRYDVSKLKLIRPIILEGDFDSVVTKLVRKEFREEFRQNYFIQSVVQSIDFKDKNKAELEIQLIYSKIEVLNLEVKLKEHHMIEIKKKLKKIDFSRNRDKIIIENEKNILYK